MLMYDQPSYDPFWAAVQDLDTVVYMHPRTPTPGQFKTLWADRAALLTAPLSFGQDVERHALGLCVNGVFDRFPGVKFVIGHMGEMIPAHLWRLGTKSRLQGHIFDSLLSWTYSFLLPLSHP
jgi:2,3-dihydroxybenzoate decarboxylase